MTAPTRGLEVRIGINPISWSNDDLPSLGGEIPLETALTEGKAIGYEGFELGNKFPRDPNALGDVLGRLHVRTHVVVIGKPHAARQQVPAEGREPTASRGSRSRSISGHGSSGTTRGARTGRGSRHSGGPS